jgi:type VI secretion system secreted protein Hcp
MAVDYFLKLEGVDGESNDSKHKGEIDLESWSWGATQTGTMAGQGGGGAGKTTVQDLHFTTTISKASPRFLMACTTGEHIKKATLVCRKAGKDQQEYLTYKLEGVIISSYQTGGSKGDTLPVDQLSLNFAKIEMEYKPQKADGTLEPGIKAGWDVKANKKV